MGQTEELLEKPVAERRELEERARSYYALTMELLKGSSGKVRDGVIDFEPKGVDGQKMIATIYTSGGTESAPMVKKEVDCKFDRHAFNTMKDLYDGGSGVTVNLQNKWKQGDKSKYTVWHATITVRTED